ncbi:MAG: hypothetical protein ACLFR2_03880 [Candidatus Kapaibacterium sp.]
MKRFKIFAVVAVAAIMMGVSTSEACDKVKAKASSCEGKATSTKVMKASMNEEGPCTKEAKATTKTAEAKAECATKKTAEAKAACATKKTAEAKAECEAKCAGKSEMKAENTSTGETKVVKKEDSK